MADDEREAFLCAKRAENYNISNQMAEKYVDTLTLTTLIVCCSSLTVLTLCSL